MTDNTKNTFSIFDGEVYINGVLIEKNPIKTVFYTDNEPATDSQKLEILALELDIIRGSENNEVQCDLRRIAKRLREIDAK